ncbi:MAG TPA: hypothetical protein VEN99_10205, partial [Acidimicrobiia bacterium]|nr:hypothetical protein [Acidimicrobiia bacterium]
TTSTTAGAGVSEPATSPPADAGATETDRGVTPAPARHGNQLGQTGDGTRRLVILGGVALLVGAVVIAFTGRDEPLPAAVGPAAIGVRSAGRRRDRRRREIDGWEDGVPLAPGKRELARRRAGVGVSAYPGPDGGPEA